MVQGFNTGMGNDNSLCMFLLLMMLCPGMFGGMGGGMNCNNILPLILIMSCCGSPC